LPQGFSPHLSWSHYRALLRVENIEARDFYEREGAECGWSKVQLERQIHSFYYDRIVANRGVKGLLPEGRERLPGERIQPSHLLKSPMVLEFLGLPDSRELHEICQALRRPLQNPRRQSHHRSATLLGQKRGSCQILDPEREQADFCFQIPAKFADGRTAPVGDREGTASHRVGSGGKSR